MRVLIIAEACNPEWVSVPLVGWSLSRAIAKITDAHVVTQVRNREALLRVGLVEGRDFTAIDSEAIAARAYKLSSLLRGGSGKGWTTNAAFASLAYYYFERLVWRTFGSRIIAKEFDVVHRITPLSPTTPSPMARRCRSAGVPFVLGPLNGGVPWPRAFDAARRREKEWLSYVRGLHKLLPGYRSTRKNASAILIASRDTWAQMPPVFQQKCVYIPENAIDPARFTRRRSRRAAKPIRIVFLGRLVPYKGAHMLIEAAAPLVREGKVTVEIIGHGPQRPELQELIQRENLAAQRASETVPSSGTPGEGREGARSGDFHVQDRLPNLPPEYRRRENAPPWASVTLAGWVEHSKVQDRLADADLFVFPSIREFGGGVVLEAMAVGLVPVVIDYAGPAELVTADSGFLIPLGTREQIIERLRALLSEMADHPEKIEAKSTRALRRAHELFTWDVKARRILDVYKWVANRRLTKPDFGMPWPDPAPA